MPKQKLLSPSQFLLDLSKGFPQARRRKVACQTCGHAWHPRRRRKTYQCQKCTGTDVVRVPESWAIKIAFYVGSIAFILVAGYAVFLVLNWYRPYTPPPDM